MRPEILKARMHGSVKHQPDSWNLIKYLIVYSSEHQPDSWNLLVMQVQNILKKKINKFYLKSPIPPLLCTTACRITFNDEDFCILMKNQQMSKPRPKEPKPRQRVTQTAKINVGSPDSSGFVDAQSASFPGSDEDFKTLFVLTNSLALLAANAACNEKSLSHTASEKQPKSS